MKRTNKAAAAALAVVLGLSAGLAGCGGDEASDAASSRPDMPAADAELLDYINASWDEYQFAQSLDEVPSDVVTAASEQLAAEKEQRQEGPKETEGDLAEGESSAEEPQDAGSPQ